MLKSARVLSLGHVDDGPHLLTLQQPASQGSGDPLQLLLNNLGEQAWQPSIRHLQVIQLLAHAMGYHHAIRLVCVNHAGDEGVAC